jgi:Protein of unknown function (DUF4232)
MILKSAKTLGAVATAVLAAGLAASTLTGCAAVSGTGASALGTAPAETSPTGPELTLPAVPIDTATSQSGGSASGGGSSNGGSSAGGPTHAGVPQCMTVDLSPEANIVADSAAAGHITMNITVTNTSGHACTIYGFPGLELEDVNQHDQATKVTWDPAVPKTLITLANGQSASSSAQLDKDLPVGSEPLTGPCEPASYEIQITPPNNTTQLVAPIGDTDNQGITVCDFGALDTLAFVPGSTGPHE